MHLLLTPNSKVRTRPLSRVLFYCHSPIYCSLKRICFGKVQMKGKGLPLSWGDSFFDYLCSLYHFNGTTNFVIILKQLLTCLSSRGIRFFNSSASCLAKNVAMSKFDPEPMPYEKLNQNLRIVKDRYVCLYVWVLCDWLFSPTTTDFNDPLPFLRRFCILIWTMLRSKTLNEAQVICVCAPTVLVCKMLLLKWPCFSLFPVVSHEWLFHRRSTVITWSRLNLAANRTCLVPRKLTKKCTIFCPPLRPSMVWASGSQAVESFTRYVHFSLERLSYWSLANN